jgi:hypothetical protein
MCALIVVVVNIVHMHAQSTVSLLLCRHISTVYHCTSRKECCMQLLQSMYFAAATCFLAASSKRYWYASTCSSDNDTQSLCNRLLIVANMLITDCNVLTDSVYNAFTHCLPLLLQDLTTQYGAIVCTTQLGPATIDTVLVPLFPACKVRPLQLKHNVPFKLMLASLHSASFGSAVSAPKWLLLIVRAQLCITHIHCTQYMKADALFAL